MELAHRAEAGFSLLRSLILGGLVLLFFIAPLVFYPWVTTFTMIKETTAELLLLGIAALWVIWMTSGKRRPSLKTSLTIPIIALAVAILLSLVNTESFCDSAQGLALWGSYIVAYFIVISVVESSRWIKILLGAALSAGFVAATYCILQFYGVDFRFWLELSGRGRLFSTFGNPNYLAGYLIGCLPMAFVWFVSVKKHWKKLVTGILIVIPYTAVLMTYTRASWAGLLASGLFTLVVLFIFLGRGFFRRNRYWLGSLALILLAITVLYSVPNPVNWPGRSVVGRAASSFDMSSYASRFLIWLSTIEVAKQHPIIGSGIGTLGVRYPEAQGEVLAQSRYRQFIPQANKSINAHNDFLHMWAEIGILGLLCAAWIIIAFYMGAFRSLKRANSEQKTLLVGFMGGALAILAHSVFSFPFHVIQNGLLFWLFLGLSWVTMRQSRVEKPESEVWSQESQVQPVIPNLQDPELSIPGSGLPTQDSRPRTWKVLRWVIVAVVIVAVVFLATARVRLFQADMHFKRGQMLAQVERSSEAAEELERAVALAPSDGRIQADLGIAYNELGHHYEAIEALKKAEKNWIYNRLYNQLGYAYQKVGQMEEAKQAFEKNIYLFPNYADAYLNLGNVHVLQAEEHLSAGGLEMAESELDEAFFYYEQAKALDPNLDLPATLVNDYYKVGLERTPGESSVSKEYLLFTQGEMPVIDLLKPVARPGKPIYFKLFFYVEDLSGHAEGTLEIEDIEGKIVKRLDLLDGGNILSLLLQDGLPEGDYLAQATVRYGGDKVAEARENFIVIEEGKTLITITDISVPRIHPWEPVTVHLTVKNQWNVPLSVQGVVEIVGGAGEEVGEIPVFSTLISANNEKELQLTWQEDKLDPGLYEARALIAYRDKIAKGTTFFLVAR